MPDRWIGWHFLPEDGHTRWNRTKVRVGSVLRETQPLEMCKCGLHASQRAMDALEYAPGPIVCLVELRGKRLDDSDKSCASERKCLARIDGTLVLHEFACWCAWRALLAERKAGREPDKRSWEAVRIKRRWLKGKASDGELTTASAAAGAAAGAATWAAWAAAWAASRAAAWAAAGAAWAARDAARDAQKRKLESMLLAAMGKTRRDLEKLKRPT